MLGGVRIFSETDWTLLTESSARDWITISGDKTSGKATGTEEEEWVIFSVKENNTGRERFGKLILLARPYDDQSQVETTIVDIYQAGQ